MVVLHYLGASGKIGYTFFSRRFLPLLLPDRRCYEPSFEVGEAVYRGWWLFVTFFILAEVKRLLSPDRLISSPSFGILVWGFSLGRSSAASSPLSFQEQYSAPQEREFVLAIFHIVLCCRSIIAHNNRRNFSSELKLGLCLTFIKTSTSPKLLSLLFSLSLKLRLSTS